MKHVCATCSITFETKSRDKNCSDKCRAVYNKARQAVVKRNWYLKNKSRVRDKAKSYYQENKESIRKSNANYRKKNKQSIANTKRKSKYGIESHEYERLYTIQNGLCAICLVRAKDSRGRELNVDHDHTTGKVRGLLCSSCNMGIGMLLDDYQNLMRAAAYLKENK